MPASKRFFNQQDQYAIAQAVAAAEHGHIGEIQVVIEGHMPAREAYYFILVDVRNSFLLNWVSQCH